MSRRVVIADAGPLIALARIESLALLRSLFGRICITTVVRDEVLPAASGHVDTELLARTLAEGLRPGEWCGWSVHKNLARKHACPWLHLAAPNHGNGSRRFGITNPRGQPGVVCRFPLGRLQNSRLSISEA